jgi:hypothetical protein
MLLLCFFSMFDQSLSLADVVRSSSTTRLLLLILASTFDVVEVVRSFFLSSPPSSRSLVDMVSEPVIPVITLEGPRTLNPL